MKRLETFISGTTAGFLTNSGSAYSFEYIEDYPESETPVSLSMPVFGIKYKNRTVRPILEGLFPDNPNALSAMAKKYGSKSTDPFALLEKVGLEVAGALEFKSPNESSEKIEDEILTSTQVLSELLGIESEYETGESRVSHTNRLSLAGAQPKTALLKTKKNEWIKPGSDSLSTHILKLSNSRYRDLDVVEHQTMSAAKNLGLNVANTELIEIDDRLVLVIERFDRIVTSDNRVQRLHQEDLCQALGVSPVKKYESEGGPSVKKISQLIGELPLKSDREKFSVDIFKGITFNTLSGCADAHLKNYSIFLKGQNVSLTPLYDLSTTLIYESLSRDSALKINGKTKFELITKSDLLELAKIFKINNQLAQEIVTSIEENLPEAFLIAGEEILNQNFIQSPIETIEKVNSEIKNLQRARLLNS